MTNVVRPASSRSSACLDERFARPIKGAGCFVEDDDRRVFAKQAGQRDALPLALAERMAPLADERVIPLRQRSSNGVNQGGTGGSLDFIGRGVRRAIADVVGQRAAEDHRLLRHHAQMLAQTGRGKLAKADVHRAGFGRSVGS